MRKTKKTPPRKRYTFRAPTEHVLLDFCNMDLNLESLKAFCHKHEITSQIEGALPYCITERDTSKRFILEHGHKVFSGDIDKWVSPEDDGFSALWGHLEKSQRYYRRILDGFIAGNPPLSDLQDIINGAGPIVPVSTKEKGKVLISFLLPNPGNLAAGRFSGEIEGHIDRDIARIILNDHGFGLLKRCDQCGRYFVGKQAGRGRYCSDVCKNAFHNQTEKSRTAKREKARIEREAGNPSYFPK